MLFPFYLVNFHKYCLISFRPSFPEEYKGHLVIYYLVDKIIIFRVNFRPLSSIRPSASSSENEALLSFQPKGKHFNVICYPLLLFTLCFPATALPPYSAMSTGLLNTLCKPRRSSSNDLAIKSGWPGYQYQP